MWAEETPHHRFWRRLQDDRLAEMMGDPAHLRALRFKPEIVARTQKHLGPALERRNTTLYKLIASAYGEVWDAEDEEKSQYAVAHRKKEAAIKQSDDNLARTREESACGGKHQLQGKPEASERELEEGRQDCREGGGKSGAEEEEEEEAKGAGGGGRGKGFYRAAGGSC